MTGDALSDGARTDDAGTGRGRSTTVRKRVVRRWRIRALVVALGLVAAAAVADHRGVQTVGLETLDWLTVAAGVVAVAYVVVPLVADPALAGRCRRALREDPLALASLAYLLAVLVAGLLGPPLIGFPESTLPHGYQPPAFATVAESVPPQCLGQVTGIDCHGTVQYPFGTNGQGQDMLPVVLLGARVAVQVALVTAAILVPIGVLVGLAAGYRGGLVDDVLMRAVDVQGAVPAFLVYVVLVYVFGRSLLLLVVVFGLLSWGKVARLVRSEVRQQRAADFVAATRSIGASELYVVRNTVLPNVSGTVVTAVTRQASTLILLEAALAFMELSEGSTGSWGESIRLGMTDIFPMDWWVSTWPVLALAGTVVALNVLGDSLRDVLDPRTRAGDLARDPSGGTGERIQP